MKNKKKILSITFLSVLTCTLVFIIFFSNKNDGNIKITRLEIVGSKLLSASTYYKYSNFEELITKQNITLPMIREIFFRHPYVKDVYVEQVSNNKVVAHIIEKNVEAIILKDGNSYFLTDDFKLIGILDNTIQADFPLITNSSLMEIDFLHSVPCTDIKDAMTIIETAKLINQEFYNNLSEINLRNGGEILLYFSGFNPVIILGKKQLAKKLFELKNIVSDIQIKQILENAGYVDLRYDNNIFIGLNQGSGIN